MQNVITIGRELVPVEQIAYVEPFEPSPNGQFKPKKPFKSRVVLLNRETVLTETTPQEFAEANGFRLLPEDNVATNLAITFRVESFAPTEDFNPAKPYQTRLMWRGPDGNSHSKLLLTKPEMVIMAASARAKGSTPSSPRSRISRMRASPKRARPAESRTGLS
jgi:hypothetical protein